jgi:hypothetical protein
MSRRFQFSLKWLFVLTFIASVGTVAYIQYERRAKIADAQAMVKFRRKVLERLVIFTRDKCIDLRVIDEKEAELHKAEERLKELQGD